MLRFVLASLILALACGAGGCAPAAPPHDVTAAPERPPRDDAPVIADPASAEEPGPIPVSKEDPTLGTSGALVTLVVFGDFGSERSTDAARALKAILGKYGTEELRVAFKHHPVLSDTESVRAALIAAAIHERGGNAAFWRFFEEVLVRRAPGIDARAAVDAATTNAAADLGVAESALRETAESGMPEKVGGDAALAKSVRARGRPSFFVNGAYFAGPFTEAAVRERIEVEIRQAEDALASGVPKARLYAHRVVENLRSSPERPSEADAKPDDPTVHFVPVGRSPVRGSASAPVTVVVFTDFACRFCAKLAPTVAELEKKHGADVRLVFKHRPMPMHDRAIPIANVAHEIFVKKGAAAFYAAHDAIFANAGKLDDDALRAIAKQAGVAPHQALAAAKTNRHALAIEEDEMLAEDLQVTGTPTLFINGKRLFGAQPLEKISQRIDAELALARSMTSTGIAPEQVYDEIMKTAARASPPVKKDVGAPPKEAPSRGAKDAPVTIQVFSDFECPFCARYAPILVELEKELRGKVRIVWRNMPLPMHKDARLAAVAALEAKKQRGDAGFWKMHDALYTSLHDGGVGRENLEKAAKKLGLDMKKLEAALDGTAHDASIAFDVEAAKKLGVTGVPGAFVNGYPVSGAASKTKLKRLVRWALEDAKSAAP
jgi:protein-disulfide isomerase